MGFGGIYTQHQIREDFEGDFGNCGEMETYAGGIGTFSSWGWGGGGLQLYIRFGRLECLVARITHVS